MVSRVLTGVSSGWCPSFPLDLLILLMISHIFHTILSSFLPQQLTASLTLLRIIRVPVASLSRPRSGSSILVPTRPQFALLYFPRPKTRLNLSPPMSAASFSALPLSVNASTKVLARTTSTPSLATSVLVSQLLNNSKRMHRKGTPLLALPSWLPSPWPSCSLRCLLAEELEIGRVATRPVAK